MKYSRRPFALQNNIPELLQRLLHILIELGMTFTNYPAFILLLQVPWAHQNFKTIQL